MGACQMNKRQQYKPTAYDQDTKKRNKNNINIYYYYYASEKMNEEILKKCRACLNPLEKAKYDILSSSELSQLYFRISNSQLDPEDPLSKSLCQKCFDCLNEFDAFQKMCLLSYNTVCSWLEKNKINQHVLRAEEIEDENPDNLIGGTGETKNISRNENCFNYESYTNDFKKDSKYDPLDFEEGENSQEVQTFDESDDEILSIKIERIKQKNIFYINDRNDTNPHENLEAEVSNSKKITSAFQKDELSANKSYNYEETIESSDTNESVKKTHRKSYFCLKCTRGFYSKVHYEGHMRKHEGKKPYFCEKCPREYSRLTRLRAHISNEHSGDLVRFYCSVEGCERHYKNRESLNRHVNSHFNPSLKKITERIAVICEICGKSVSKNVLGEHRMMHKGIFPHACDQCPKKFRFLNKLEHHKLVHLGIKKYSCNICGMKKTTRKEVKAHMNVHTREKQYPCEFCTACFLTKANLERHIRVVHDKMKTFQCTCCGQSFGKAETLKHHMMRHTGERPHKCPYCDRRFIQKAAMKIHARRHEVKRDNNVDTISSK